MWLKKIKACILLGLFYSFCVVANDQSLTSTDDLIKTEPELVLEQALSSWSGDISVQNIPTGITLIKAYKANKQFDQASELLASFMLLKPISEQNMASLLIQKISIIRNSNYNEDPAPWEAQAQQLMGNLEANSADKANQKLLLRLYEELGQLKYYAGKFAEAEPYFSKALKHINQDDFEQISSMHNSLGVVKAQVADLAGAAEHMLASVRISEEHGLAVHSSQYLNIGSLFYMLKEWDNAIEHYHKALNLTSDQDHTTASIYSSLAAVYVENENYDEAEINAKKSISISEKLNSSTADARNNLGNIYQHQGKYQAALEQLHLSAEVYLQEGSIELQAVSVKSQGDVYVAMGQPKQAAELYEQAYQLFKVNDYKPKRVELYPKMIDNLTTLGEYEQALKLMQEYKALNDEIVNIESNNKVNELMTGFEFEKKQKELVKSELQREKQQKNIDILNSRNELEERIRYLMIIMFTALLLLLFFIVRSWRFRGKYNQALLDKNERIESQQNQLVALNKQLKGQAEVDSLTGINNRNYITSKLVEIITSPEQENKKWCLIIIDIDNFKTINDTYGHQRGDGVLQQFAECLDWVRSPEDVIARWGGEEFLWLVESKSPAAGPNSCDAFQTALADLDWFRGNEDTVTCSLGFTSFPLIDMSFADWEAALKLADYALYQAKYAGKNCWRGFETVDPKLEHDDIKNIEKLVKSKRLRIITKP